MNKLLIVGSQTIHTYNYIELVKDFFDDILLVTDKGREGHELRVKELDFSLKLKNLIETVRGIRKQIKEFKPTVIHIHQANSYAFYTLKAAKSFRIPVILTVWGSDVLVNPKKSFHLKKIVQYNLRRADYVTTDSLYVASEVKRLVPSRTVELVANFGVELLPVNVERQNIVYSNRLHKKLYRIDKIILAFEKFSQQKKDWKLVIAAEGDQTNFLKELVRLKSLEGKVEFVGWLNPEENARWYAQSKIWVSIPESDGVGISMLEAMAYGCIPVISDLPVKHEWITNGANGILVSDVDTEFISEAFSLEQPEVQKINHVIIAERGTKTANSEKFIHLYKKILNK